MTSADAGSEQDLRSAVELLEQTTEEVWAEASRVSQAAMALRDAIDARTDELGRSQQELRSRLAAIEEEVERARAEADVALQAIRDDIAGEQERLAELQRQQAETTNEVGELARAKDMMLAQLGRAQQQLHQVLPAMEDLLRAKDTLHTVMTSFGEEPEPAEVVDRLGRPIGRIMDLGGDDR